MNQHELYTAPDFTKAEYDSGNALARAVIDGGLEACKRCGASEIELETWVTCETYRAAQKANRA